MCGRFTNTLTAPELERAFGLQGHRAALPPRFNLAPTQDVPVVANTGERLLDAFRFGLVPFWSKDAKQGARLINARAESLAKRPAFRMAERRRCLVLADGFYEWKLVGGQKIPVYLHRPDDAPFAFAGIWDSWRAPDGTRVHSCAIVTAPAQGALRALHDRLPVILPEALYDLWLDPAPIDLTAITPALIANEEVSSLALRGVTAFVNSVAHEGPACIAAPADELPLS